MPERPAPRVTVHGRRDERPVADVIGSGADEAPPGGRRRAAARAAGLAAVAAVAVVALQDGGARAPAPVRPSGLVVVGTDSGLSAQWGPGGYVDVSLPAYLRNDGDATTVSSVTLDGTALAQPAVDVEVQAGGRFPVSLRQTAACADTAPVPAGAVLRVELRRDGVAETRLLALPDGVVQSLQDALTRQCAAVPLERALVLSSEEEQVLPASVAVRVRAANIGTAGLQLLSLAPSTGLSVTVAPTAGSAEPPVDLPHVLSPGRLVLRLSVSVSSCAAVVLTDPSNPLAVADLLYDDGKGARSGAPVVGDFPGVRDLVERTC